MASIDQVVSVEKMLKMVVIYMYIAPGQGQTTPGVNGFHKLYFSVNSVLCCKFSLIMCLLNDFAIVFPHSNV